MAVIVAVVGAWEALGVLDVTLRETCWLLVAGLLAVGFGISLTFRGLDALTLVCIAGVSWKALVCGIKMVAMPACFMLVLALGSGVCAVAEDSIRRGAPSAERGLKA